jgi:hypothetical protein
MCVQERPGDSTSGTAGTGNPAGFRFLVYVLQESAVDPDCGFAPDAGEPPRSTRRLRRACFVGYAACRRGSRFLWPRLCLAFRHEQLREKLMR